MPLNTLYGKHSKIPNSFLFLFSNKMLVFKAGIHKILVRIANREDSDQTASSDLGLPCLSRPFWQATLVRDFRTFTANVNAQVSSEASCLNF